MNAFAKGSIEMNPRFNTAIAVFRCHHAVDRKCVSPGNQCVEHLGEVEKAQGVGRAHRHRKGASVVINEFTVFFRYLRFNQVLQF